MVRLGPLRRDAGGVEEEQQEPLMFGREDEEEMENFKTLGEKPLSTTRASWELFRVSAPVILTFILEMLPGVVNVISVGHLGPVELASMALATMFCNVTGVSLGFGMASAMDTLCSQAFGANNKRALGLILQRALLIELVLCIPVFAIWYFAGHILTMLGQEPEVAALSEVYCRTMMLGLYPLLVYEVLKKFLQGQQIVVPQMLIVLGANGYTVFANWFFVYHLGFGFSGAGYARVTTNWLLPLLTLAYILVFKRYRGTWAPWGRESLQGWGEFLKLGVPGMLMLCLEWWAFEILSFVAGNLGTLQLAAHSVIFSLTNLTFFLPYGASVATSILVGNYLGERKPANAKQTTYSALYFAAAIELGNAFLLVSLKDVLPKIFTQDEVVQSLVSQVLPLAAMFQIFDGIAAITGGVLRGCGRQMIGAVYNFVAYYVIGLPLGCSLAFGAGWELMGLWSGIAVSLFLITLVSVAVVLRTDWEAQVAAAQKRVREMEQR